MQAYKGATMRLIGLSQTSKTQPHVLQCFVEHDKTCWRLWLSYNNDMTKGSYYELKAGGAIDLVTINPDNSLTIRHV